MAGNLRAPHTSCLTPMPTLTPFLTDIVLVQAIAQATPLFRFQIDPDSSLLPPTRHEEADRLTRLEGALEFSS